MVDLENKAYIEYRENVRNRTYANALYGYGIHLSSVGAAAPPGATLTTAWAGLRKSAWSSESASASVIVALKRPVRCFGSAVRIRVRLC